MNSIEQEKLPVMISVRGEQYFDDETAENIEKIVNQLKKLTMEVSIVNYKEKVA